MKSIGVFLIILACIVWGSIALCPLASRASQVINTEPETQPDYEI